MSINFSESVTCVEYLQEQLKQATAEPVKHGACLALGIAGMGTARTDLYAALKAALELDDAVIGEAAATSAGLIMLGVHARRSTRGLTPIQIRSSSEFRDAHLCLQLDLL